MSFCFKKFSIEDKNTPMKLGIDAVVLGVWVDLFGCKSVLDVGSGTGIISLILAQRYKNMMISSLEINERAFIDLKNNIEKSPWKNRITPNLGDFRSYQFDNTFDVIISNPPYFDKTSNSLEDGRDIARQKFMLSPADLCKKAFKLLKKNSSLIVIFPYHQRKEFIINALLSGFYLKKELRIKDNKQANFKRSILHFSKNQVDSVFVSDLTLKQGDGSYTPSFIELAKDFYIDL